MVNEVLIFDFLPFQEECEASTKIGTWEDAISFGDSIFSHQFFVPMSDRLNLEDSLVTTNDYERQLSDSLSFVDEISPFVRIESVGDILQLFDAFTGVKPTAILDALEFTESYTAYSGPIAIDLVEFLDEITIRGVINLPMSDSLTLTDGLTRYLNNPWTPMVPIAEET